MSDTRSELITEAQAILNETVEGGNSKTRVGELLDKLIKAVLLETVVVSSPTEDTTVSWGTRVILKNSSEAATVTVDTLNLVPLQSVIELENYTGRQIQIILSDGDMQEPTPTGGFVLPTNGKCHIQLTETGRVSIVGHGV